jgi:hypothetical protein
LDRVNALTILMPIVQKLIDSLDEDILAIGAEVGGMVPRQSFIMRGAELDDDAAKLHILKILGGYDNWFTVNYP